MSQSERAGSIYDLGYQRYQGARLGRRYAIQSLYLFSLRGAYGLGRRATSKIIPVAIAIIAAIPALIQLGIAAIASTNNLEIIRPENYFGFIQITLALFCAAVAPEVMGRDQRTRTLPLYFSRALSRQDYVLAKLLALASAMLVLTLVPELVLFIGNSLASNNATQFWKDNWFDLPRIVLAGVLAALLFGSLSLLVAAQTARRAYATIAVLAVFVVVDIVADIVVNTGSDAVAKVATLVSPVQVTSGTIYWIFGQEPDSGSSMAKAGWDGSVYFLVCLAAVATATLLVIRKYERVSV